MVKVTEQPSLRVSIDRQEFDAFLVENEHLVERLEKLLQEVDALKSLNKSLEERFRAMEQETVLTQEKGTTDLQGADETLRMSRSIMARLLGETDRRLSGENEKGP